ncbi:Asp-tRNA(Asn)/Glu-tRNA(Gln) amidotransferase subunit GatA [Corallococcus exiguus]|uniref:Glutamyl-tRNA(Gln) amidotransferase subunit A n=1 Tax=Corallococcus exiguus TaxID=83462 RepID=A0A7X5BRR9_9BACT|nr:MULTISPECIES: Asp-tRNA(Asn)/Glu-tRNA(Gln) amidotransferase subunit GatA [Corallococcus]NBC39433.1 Asp-tRNA(Asn)/Glu-tRNA(Gln) amidotransferase subunit GatA [Corallococcus exiguus]NNC20443.1 Asp-tRNA(Asn)/Glu-tRNA(Gln) amidotransferase subunit GatA [Corallococcus exiguus]NRD57931.1 Asp-tRNA(Asn)/Glu-tRNA(Gln) amidotransferase subunit GatA [Corallococcus exiguus]NRD66583.1 Asp-tRNA(Asn)/Glu-tRNA(Gln) amidotransferase subunit GatA [Corallococcus exiguus]RKH18218.1 Asp-tRNA(Asn)/Glu-tRNA(Gln) a
MSSLTDLSMLELAAKLASREVSSVEATQASLQRIAQVDPKVRAFLRVDEPGALKSAEASDARRKAGSPLSALDGVPVGLKDIFLTEGVETTCASRVLEGFVPPYDATVVRLLKEAGLPLVGKLNMDEFAMGSSNESSAYFPTHNPWDLTRTPGGSSGGSAAAVAAREVFGALGTDTGGSIRQPAALTNTVGLKPTYGRVSRYGVIAFASSLDQPGPMARTVGDTAALFQLIARHDPLDSTSADVETPDCLTGLEDGVRGLKLGVPREYFAEGMDPEVAGTLRASLEELEKLGATLVDVSLPHTKYALATYYLLASSEASSNLARYDGIRYGQRAKDARGLKELYTQTRGQGFGAEVKRRIMLGTYALSAGYYDAYYLRAQKVRTLIREDFTKVFQQVDAIVSPTSPVPAFKLGAKVDDPLSMYLMDVYTLPCNLAGLPGLSVPCGFTQAGLPIGMQLLGRPFDEARLLRIARAFEREHDFFRRAAPV